MPAMHTLLDALGLAALWSIGSRRVHGTSTLCQCTCNIDPAQVLQIVGAKQVDSLAGHLSYCHDLCPQLESFLLKCCCPECAHGKHSSSTCRAGA